MAYLNQQGLACKLVNATSSQDAPEFHVELENEEQLARARGIVEGFLQNPNHPQFAEAAWQQGSPASLQYADTLSVNKIKQQLLVVPFTSSILLLALLIHFLVFAAGQFQLFDYLSFQPFTLVFSNGEIWRLFTPTLMHFSTIHLAFNLMWWFWLGRNIESTLGIGMLVTIYLVTGLVSNYSQFLVSGDNFGGLSGVVYALLGFCWWLGWQRPEFGISVPNAIVGFMLVWLIIGFADVLWINMANTAHLMGLLSGCALGQLVVMFKKQQ